MSTNFRIVYVLCMSFVLMSCTVSSKSDTPDAGKVASDDIQRALATLKACNKSDAEMAISDEAKANALTIEDKIESQDIEQTDCDGNVKNSHGPVRNLDQVISVAAPHAFSDKVTFVKVENARTCSTHIFDSAETQAVNEVKIGGETPIKLNDVLSSADSAGNTRIVLNDADIKLNIYLNVKDGSNVLKISYFGKCLKPRENPDTTIKNQYYLCEQAELLGTKEVLLTVHVDRPEVPGTSRVNTCWK